MKGMPLPFDFEGKRGVSVSESSSSSSSSPFSNLLVQNKWKKEGFFVGFEPTSVLETIRSPSPSPPTSTSTLSSSLGGGGGGGGGGGASGGGGSTDTTGVAAISGNPSQKWPPAPQETGSSELHPQGLEISAGGGGSAAAAGADKCGLGMEDWESVLSESVAASPSQEQSILRWIMMGDSEDPSLGLNKLLQTGAPPEFDYSGGFGVVDQGFGLDTAVSGGGGNVMGSVNTSIPNSGFSLTTHKFNNEKMGNIGLSPNPSNPNIFSPLSNNLSPMSFNQPPPFECSELKPPIFNPQLLINQHQVHNPQNPSFFLPLSLTHQDQPLLLPPQAKRHNPGGGHDPNSSLPKAPFSDSGQPQGLPHQFQLLPQYLQQRPSSMGVKPKMGIDEMGSTNNHQNQAIIDQLYKAAELVQTGSSILAQEILARLNHQLSPIGKPFQRASFYCKEALQMILHNMNNHPSSANCSPFSLVYKIGSYKTFSEISPFLQFANFTCNQAILEVIEGFDRIHVIDFDIGFGGQWASLMQELALRSGVPPSLKITVFASPSTHDQIELGLTRENLTHFASEINMAFEFEVLSLDLLNSISWSLPLRVSENEAIAVNLPIGSFSNHQLSLPLVLRFVKQLSPKIVVSMDRGSDRTDLPFPNHVIHVLQSYSNLLESLDAVNVNLDALQKIERYFIQPGIEKIVTGRFRFPEKTTPHWRTLFLSSGFSPVPFSNFTVSQAECVVKRTPVRGFHVEKRQSSLLLCWQRKELVSASAWRC